MEGLRAGNPQLILRDYGIRKSNCSTAAIPALVMVTVTALVEPSVGGTSAPDDHISNFCATACGRMRSDSPISVTT